MHCIRAAGTYISGTNGVSNGLVPMLRVYNNTARYVDQGGNKRPGAFAIYLEPWHADIFEFLDLRKNTGSEELRARDLFYAMWVPDLFMKRVQADGLWSLMCPHECPGLQDCWGEAFEELYEKYEGEKRYKRQVRAQQLWYAIIESQIETGNPYMVSSKQITNIFSNYFSSFRSTRTTAIASRTSRTWAPSSAPTSARRSSSTPAGRRSPSATSPPSP